MADKVDEIVYAGVHAVPFKRSRHTSPVYHTTSVSLSLEEEEEGGEGGRDLEVDVRMADRRDEGHGGRRVRIRAGDLDVDLPLPAFVRTAVAALEHREPVREVVFGDGGEGGETRVWLFAVAGELFDEALADGGSGGGGGGHFAGMRMDIDI